MMRFYSVNSNMDHFQGYSDMDHSWFSAPLDGNDMSHIGLKPQTDR